MDKQGHKVKNIFDKYFGTNKRGQIQLRSQDRLLRNSIKIAAPASNKQVLGRTCTAPNNFDAHIGRFNEINLTEHDKEIDK